MTQTRFYRVMRNGVDFGPDMPWTYSNCADALNDARCHAIENPGDTYTVIGLDTGIVADTVAGEIIAEYRFSARELEGAE